MATPRRTPARIPTQKPAQWTRSVAVLTAPNPGPMTLDGTNSYIVSAPGSRSVVIVDPGPNDSGHLDALARTGRVELVLITHQHSDHTEGAEALAAATGAPVRAPSPADCVGGPVLVDGERISSAGLELAVVATPGHTADSVCFHLAGDEQGGSVLTGDTVLGRGSTVIGIPDGTLGQYLESLQRIASLATAGRPLIGLPAHGPRIDDLAGTCARYRDHRLHRLAQVREALATLGLPPDPDSDETVGAVLAAVYGEIEPGVAFAAAYSVATQLAHLRDAGGR